MTENQQKCFLAVAEHRSFSKAAGALYVSQPAVSKNISTLEDELGAALFDRQGKLVVLTHAGEILFSFLSEYRREFDSMLYKLRNLDRGITSGTIRIGCGITWNAAHFYTRLTRHFAIHFPGLQLEVEGLEPENFMAALRQKEVDAMIMYAYDLEKQPDIDSVPLTNIGCGFLCSSVLTKTEGAELQNLSEHPFILAATPTDRRNSNLYRQHVTAICEKHGFTPSFRNCRNLSAGLVDVSCGKGLLFSDDWTASINNSEFTYIPAGESIPLCLAYLPAPTDSLLGLFIRETKKVFEGNL